MANDAQGTEYIQAKDRHKPVKNNAIMTRGPDREGRPYFILKVHRSLTIKAEKEIFWNYNTTYWKESTE